MLKVEVGLGLRGPPALDEVAIETRMEPDRGHPVGGEEDHERAFGRGMKETREVDDVPAVRQEDAREALVL